VSRLRRGLAALAVLALVSGSATTSARADAPPKPSPRDDSECVADPSADARDRWQQIMTEEAAGGFDHGIPWDIRMWERRWPDLDGDGLAERSWVIPTRCGASGNCDRLLYASNEGCTRYVGHTFGVQTEVLPSRHNGLADLWSFHRTGCGGGEGVVGFLAFDGQEYQVVREVYCPCTLSEPETPRPAACRWRDAGRPSQTPVPALPATPPAPAGTCVKDFAADARAYWAALRPQTRAEGLWEEVTEHVVRDLDGDDVEDRAYVLERRGDTRGAPYVEDARFYVSGGGCGHALTARSEERVRLLKTTRPGYPDIALHLPMEGFPQRVLVIRFGDYWYGVEQVHDCDRAEETTAACRALGFARAEDR
jgi:hypothetical protein